MDGRYLERRVRYSIRARSDHGSAEFFTIDNTTFSELVETTESLIESGFDKHIEFLLWDRKGNISRYVIRKSQLEDALRNHVPVEQRSGVRNRIYRMPTPISGVYACEVILATKDLYLSDGYLKLEESVNSRFEVLDH